MAFKNVDDGKKRADEFIDEAIETGVVICLMHPEGGVLLCESNDFFDNDDKPAPVIPLWSKKYLSYAKAYGKDLEIKEFSFEEFYTEFLPAVVEDDIILGLNWDQKGYGYEEEAIEILRTAKEAFKEQ